MYDDKRASAFGKISFFLKEPIEILELQKNESMADVAGTLSHGINFKGSFEKAQNSQVKYRFAHATRDSVDVLQMGVELIGKELKEDHPIYQEDYRYFLVTGVARTRSISIVAEDKDGHAINLELEALKIGKISPSVTVEKTGEREIPFSGKRSPAFGVELFDLSYNPEENRIELEMQRDAIKLCRDQAPIRAMVSSAFIVVE